MQALSIGRRLQRISALTAFLYIPLLFSTQTRDQFELPKLMALSILVVPVVLGRLLDPLKRRLTVLEAAFLILLLVQGIGTLPSVSIAWRTSLLGEYENFGGFLTTCAFAAWFYGLGRGFPVAELRRFQFFAVTAGLLSAFYAVGQSFGFDVITWNPDTYNASRVFAGLGNPNFLSAYLAMALPLLLNFALEPGKPGSKRIPYASLAAVCSGLVLLLAATGQGSAFLGFTDDGQPGFLVALGLSLFTVGLLHPFFRHGLFAAWAGSLLLFFGLVSTASRGGWLGALAGLAVWFALRGQKPSTSESTPGSPSPIRPYRRFGLWAALILFALLGWFGRPFFERLGQSVIHPLESLGQSRLTIWGPALRMAREKPWTGVGVDCFKIAFPRYSGYDFNAIDGLFVSSRTAHNEWLQAAATDGIPGFLALFFLVGTFGVLSLKRIREAEPSVRPFWAAVLASGAAYLTQNLFSFGVAALLLLWTLNLAAVNRRPMAAEPPSGGSAAWILCLSFAAILLVPVGLRLVADLNFSRGMRILDYLRNPPQTLEPEKASALAVYSLEKTRRAADLFPWDAKYRLYTGMALEQLAETDTGRRKAWLEESLTAYDRVEIMSPSNGYYANDRGRVLTALSRFDPSLLRQAEKAQERAADLTPQSPYFLTQWGVVLTALGRDQEAQAPLAKAFALDPKLSAKALCQSALDDFLAGQRKEGWKLLDRVLAFDPRSAEGWFFRGYFLNHEGKTKEGKSAMAKALELNPDLKDLAAAAQEKAK